MLNPKLYSYSISDKKKVRLGRIARYLNSYQKKLLNEKNYPNPGDKLEDWVDHYGHSYSTTLHPVQDFGRGNAELVAFSIYNQISCGQSFAILIQQ